MSEQKHNLYSDVDPTRNLLGKWLTDEAIDPELNKRARAAVFPPAYRRSAAGILGCFKEHGCCDVVTVYDYMTQEMQGGLADKDQLMLLAQCGAVGGNAARLYAMICRSNGDAPAAASCMVPLAEFLQRKHEDPKHTLPSFGWGPGGALVLAAMGGMGKTVLVQSLAVDLASASPPLNHFPIIPAQRVGLFILEDPDAEAHKRLTTILGQRDGADLWIFDRAKQRLTLGDRGGQPNRRGFKLLDEILGDLGLTVALFDPLVNLHDANENDNSEMLRWLKPLRDLAHKHGTAVGISHHTTWGSHGQQHERGASAIRNWADTVLHMRTVEGGQRRTETRRLSVAKMNFARPFEPLIATIDPVTLRVAVDTEGATLCTPEDLLAFIQDDLGGGFDGKLTDFYQAAAQYFGAGERTIRATFADLKRRGKVHEHGKGKGFTLL